MAGHTRGKQWIPEEHDPQVVALHAEGKSLGQIAELMGFSKATVTNHATKRLGLDWSRSGDTAAAAQARSARAAEMRAQFELDLMLDAQRFRLKNYQPYTYVFTAGTVEAPEPYPADQRSFQQMAIASAQASQRIADANSDGGLGAAVSMLGRMATALGLSSEVDSTEGDE